MKNIFQINLPRGYSLLLLLASFLFTTPSWAQFSGTVTGAITAPDGRASPYTNDPNNAKRQTNKFDGIFVPLPDILVKVTIEFPWFTSPTKELWTRAGSSGTYSIQWNDPVQPTKIKAEVFAASPTISRGAITTSKPSTRFKITAPLLGDLSLASKEKTQNLTGAISLNFPFANPEESISAYLTTLETFNALDTEGTVTIGNTVSSLSTMMHNIAVEINANVRNGVTPSNAQIYIPSNIASSNPQVVAHEIGHIFEWRYFGVQYALLSLSDYDCNGDWYTWNMRSAECEKATFLEGFASLVEGLWGWRADRSITTTLGPNDFALSVAETNDGIPAGDVNFGGCAGDSFAHRRVICVFQALWDIIDRPTGDDDSIQNVRLNAFASTFVHYPNNCPSNNDNGCVGESGSDGMNWKDFRRNFEATSSSLPSLESIQNTHNLGGSVND